MESDIRTHLFIERIVDDGVHLRHIDRISEDEVIEHYEGPSGRRIEIFVSDEFIANSVAKDILRDLGCDSLIPRLFPPSAPKPSKPKK
jgi:hypothetical protein